MPRLQFNPFLARKIMATGGLINGNFTYKEVDYLLFEKILDDMFEGWISLNPSDFWRSVDRAEMLTSGEGDLDKVQSRDELNYRWVGIVSKTSSDCLVAIQLKKEAMEFYHCIPCEPGQGNFPTKFDPLVASLKN